MKIIICVVVGILAFSGQAISQNTSVYTSTKTAACRTIKSSDEGTGFYEGECKGVGGYKVRLIEGDIRETINIITPAKKTFELNFWSFHSGFSAIGEKIEWRMKGGVPVAMISRFNVADNDDPRSSRSYLMVSKISKTLSCVVDVIFAGVSQNETARKSADKASSMPCKSAD